MTRPDPSKYKPLEPGQHPNALMTKLNRIGAAAKQLPKKLLSPVIQAGKEFYKSVGPRTQQQVEAINGAHGKETHYRGNLTMTGEVVKSGGIVKWSENYSHHDEIPPLLYREHTSRSSSPDHSDHVPLIKNLSEANSPFASSSVNKAPAERTPIDLERVAAKREEREEVAKHRNDGERQQLNNLGGPGLG
jgi:hypothetical protein